VILDYLRGDEFHQTFAFDLMLITWLAAPMRKAIADSIDMLASVGGEPAWTLNNHDTQRVVTRLGRLNADDPKAWTGNNLVYVDAPIDLDLGRRRARAAIAMTAALPGALYLFEGEELGLEEYLDMPAEAREDPLFINTGGKELGRDGCRVPLPWTRDRSTNFGFSPGPVRPWLPQPEGWGPLSVEAESADPASMLAFYRTLMATRRELSGAFAWVDTALDNCIVFERGTTLVVLNLGRGAVQLPADLVGGRAVWLSSHTEATAQSVPGDTCVWLREL
jgi:alpha-glucosidase